MRVPFTEAAAYYASIGYAVLPLDGKFPVVLERDPDGKPIRRMSCYSASTDPEMHARWEQQFPGCNLGLAIPRGKVCFDIDPRNGGTPDEFFGSHPVGVQRSGGQQSGWHLLYDLADPDTRIPEWGGTNVKGHGGYIVAAPSVHPETGNEYAWEVFPTPKPASFPPPGVAARAVAKNMPVSDGSVVPGEHKQLSELRAGMRAGAAVSDVSDDAILQAIEAIRPICVPGQRYNVLTKMSPTLARLGWSATSIELFTRAAIAEFGGDNPEHGVRGALSCMNHPSGYYDLLRYAGNNVLPIQSALDRLHNPFAAELSRVHASLSEQFAQADARRREIEQRAAARTPAESPADALPVPPQLPPVPPQQPGPHPLGHRYDLRVQMPPLEYCIEGLPFHYDAVNAIVGFANAGKTPFAAALAISLATGTPFFGRRCRMGKTLVLAFESPRGFARHLQRHSAATGRVIDNIDFFEVEAGRLATDAGYLDAIKREVLAQGYRHVLIDTYSAATSGAEVNDARYAVPARALEMVGVAVFLVVHTNKADLAEPTLKSLAGTGALAGVPKAAVGLWKPESGVFEAVCVRTPEHNFPPIRYSIKDVPNGWVLEEQQPEQRENAEPNPSMSAREEVDALVKKIPTLWDGEPRGTTLSLAELLRRSRASSDRRVAEACARLVALGMITEANDGRVKAFHCDIRTSDQLLTNKMLTGANTKFNVPSPG